MSARELAIDAGQTGIKSLLIGPGGAQDGVFPGIRTHEPLLPQLAAVVREILAGFDGTLSSVSAGVSGLTEPDADASALLAAIDDVRVREVRLAHDSTTSFLGALGPARGAVVAVGTGVVTLAVGPTRVARVDGWGHIMGDAGSGYWIGREALDAVMRAYDGRGPQTALRSAVEAHWPDLEQAYIALQSSADRVRVVASFAAEVARLADAGDHVAQTISEKAGIELAHSVVTALRRVDAGVGEPADVCGMGGGLRSAHVRHAFESRVVAAGLDVRLVEPRGAGIDGAAALATLPPRHPLSSRVSTAHR